MQGSKIIFRSKINEYHCMIKKNQNNMSLGQKTKTTYGTKIAK